MTNANDNYIDFGNVAHDLLDMQTQYAKRYLDPVKFPDLAKDVRWKGDLSDYHFITIHMDDVSMFVRRVNEYHRNLGII